MLVEEQAEEQRDIVALQEEEKAYEDATHEAKEGVKYRPKEGWDQYKVPSQHQSQVFEREKEEEKAHPKTERTEEAEGKADTPTKLKKE